MIISISGYKGSGKNLVAKIIQYLIMQKKEVWKNKPFQEWLPGWNETVAMVDSDWEQKSFAHKLKQIASILTGIPEGKFENEEFKKTYLGEEWNWWRVYSDRHIMLSLPDKKVCEDFYNNINKEVCQIDNKERLLVRKFLQLLGTEAIRENIHPNTWVNALFTDYKSKFADKDGFTTYIDESVEIKMKDHPIWETSHFPNWIITDTRFPNELQAVRDRGGLCIKVVLLDENGNPTVNKDQHPSEISLDHITDWDCVISAKKGDIDSLIKQVKKFLILNKII